jgi:ATP-dependent DNA helicase RecQ
MTPEGRAVLKGAATFALRKDTLKLVRKTVRDARAGTRTGGAAPAAAAAADPALLEALKRRRLELARERGVPAYLVFADKSLIDMARRKPRTPADMAHVHGMGEVKLAQYGHVFLDVIRRHLEG